MSTRIRVAVADDISAILAIEQAAPTAAHWSADQYLSRIEDGYVIVAELEGRICGFLCARAPAGEWEIENVVVDAGFARRGIGKELMRELIKKWESGAGSVVLLEVRESNAAARALYEKSGLREVGHRRGYYREPVEDAVLYSRQREP